MLFFFCRFIWILKASNIFKNHQHPFKTYKIQKNHHIPPTWVIFSENKSAWFIKNGGKIPTISRGKHTNKCVRLRKPPGHCWSSRSRGSGWNTLKGWLRRTSWWWGFHMYFFYIDFGILLDKPEVLVNMIQFDLMSIFFLNWLKSAVYLSKRLTVWEQRGVKLSSIFRLFGGNRGFPKGVTCLFVFRSFVSKWWSLSSYIFHPPPQPQKYLRTFYESNCLWLLLYLWK